MALDIPTIGMLAVLAILVFFMFRNSRKRQREAAELQQKVQVGADVMTNFGVFGTILDIDEENNKVLLETSPGTVLTVHRQVVTRVIDDHDSDTADQTDTADETDTDATAASTTEPAFGERLGETVETTPDSKPTTSGSTLSKTDKVDE